MDNISITLTIEGLGSTQALGRAIAIAVPPRSTIGLVGTLGAGKTYLTQAIACACGVPSSEATSPTFVLCQVHHAERTIYHLDAYRITDEDEFLELGVEEMFSSEALTIIEWSDRVEAVLPRERITVELEISGPETRNVTLTVPATLKAVLDNIQTEWQAATST